MRPAKPGRASRVVVLACTLGLSASSAACSGGTPARTVVPTVHQGTKAQMRAELTNALKRVGHDCKEIEKVVVCDKEKEGQFTFVADAWVEGPTSWLGVLAFFKIKAGQKCATLDEAFTRAKSDLHMVCSDENATTTLMTTTMVPEGGFTDKDVQTLVAWFGLAMQGPLRALLDGGLIE